MHRSTISAALLLNCSLALRLPAGQSPTHDSKPGSSTPKRHSNATSLQMCGSARAEWADWPGGPCAKVSSLVYEHGKSSPNTTPTVPAELAYDCLNEIPFNQSAAVALLDSIRPYLNWQSTVQYIEEPPLEYAENVQPPFNFSGVFESVYNKAMTRSYTSEYQFGLELYQAFQRCHDGHFVFWPDSVSSIFLFSRPRSLVSVSIDGIRVPKVYDYQDVLSAATGWATFEPSPLVKIDGRNATDYLLEWSQHGSSQDPDALWNNLFHNLARGLSGSRGDSVGSFYESMIYPGAKTMLTFANDTSICVQNLAYVLKDFANITSGASVYNAFFVPPSGEPKQVLESVLTAMPLSTTMSRFASSTSTATPAPGYPTPIVRETNNLNSGYFLDGEGYEDIAVLSVPTFDAFNKESLQFQKTNSRFISSAIAHGKKKLIVDVSANGGGNPFESLNLFNQLFPGILPYSAHRHRAHEAFDYIGQETSYFSGRLSRSLNHNATALGMIASWFNFRSDADVNYRPFTSWAEKYKPHEYGPRLDKYTSISRWNLSDVVWRAYRSDPTTQPFAADNIVIVYDGHCASSCEIFSELMREQGGVKTIAFGGRPNKDMIQAVGGTKGGPMLSFADIFEWVATPFKYNYIHSKRFYNSTALGKYSNLPLLRSTTASVNMGNGYRQGMEAGPPLQFLYEPADCRIYYTPAMVVDQTAV